MNRELLYYLVLRENFGEFVKYCFKILHQKPLELNWHHKVIITELLGEHKRMVVNLPPRQLKSEIISVYYPLYLLGNTKKNTDIMIITRNKKLGIFWLDMIKTLLDQPVIQNIFPELRIILHKTDQITTTKGTITIHSSNTPIIGAGADIFIIDDPISVKDADNIKKVRGINKWFREELLTRMNDKANGRIILAMQRIHLLDLSAFMLHNQVEVNHLNIPALNEKEQQYNWQEWNVLQRKFVAKSYIRPKNEPINPARENLDTLNSLKKEMGEAFATQYQQNPVVDLEQEIICQIRELSEIPSIKKGRLVVNCIENNGNLQVLVSLTNRDKPKEIFIIKQINEKMPVDLEEFIIKILENCQKSIHSAYTSYKYRAELQVVVLCPMLKTTSKLQEMLSKFKIDDITISTNIINKVLIKEATYQEAINHLFTNKVFDAEVYGDDDFNKQLKTNLQKLAPTPFLKVLIENVAVHEK